MGSSHANGRMLASGRQVSLLEATVWAVAINALAYVLLVLLGVAGLFLDVVPAAEREPELRFTFAEGAEEAALESPAADESFDGTEPGAQTIAPEPPVEAPAALDRSLPAVPSMPVPPLPSDAPPAAEEPPPSEGVEDGLQDAESAVDDPASALDEAVPEPLDEPAEIQPAETFDEAGAGDEQPLPLTDDGAFSTPQRTAPENPRSTLGVPDGMSLDDRLSAFGRAVERFRERSADAPPQPPRNVFQPDWGSLPTTGQTVGNLTFESGDFDWDDYGRQIYWIIWRAWHNRLLARVDDFEKWAQQTRTPVLDHINGVRFTIESNGQIRDIVVEMASGSQPFDISAVEGLDSSVLPPLPAGFPRDRERVRVQFIGYGPIGSMRRGLRYYKQNGWF